MQNENLTIDLYHNTFISLYNKHIQKQVEELVGNYIKECEREFEFKFIEVKFSKELNKYSKSEYNEVNYIIIEYEGIQYRLDYSFWCLYPKRQDIHAYDYKDNMFRDRIVKSPHDIGTIQLCVIPKESLSDRFFHIKHHLLSIKFEFWLIYHNKNIDALTLC